MDLSSFKDPELARGLIHSIEKWAPEHATLMEVCGTHTVAIARNGLRTMMPEGVRLASGPGCPGVRYQQQGHRYGYCAFARSRRYHCHLWRYDACAGLNFQLAERAGGRGALGKHRVLSARRAETCPGKPRSADCVRGRGVRNHHPLVAMAIKRAKALGLKNFSVFVAHKNMPGALKPSFPTLHCRLMRSFCLVM